MLAEGTRAGVAGGGGGGGGGEQRYDLNKGLTGAGRTLKFYKDGLCPS